ncbi:MAG: glycosyltransferase family 2 protein [Desulfobacteraceae bacterium]|nr:glycosyltransferase family 2 protein [Desulfobacteraceae bacterium]
MKIAILMAALNESLILPSILQKIPKEMDVFIVDDGSTDNTKAVAESFGARVIRNPINMGQGHAFITGIKGIVNFWEHRDGCIVFLDADGQHDPDEIPKFIEKMQSSEADIVVGSRILGSNYKTAPFFRKTFLPHFTWIINKLSGYTMTDAMCGFRAFRVASLSQVENILDTMIEPQYLAAEMFMRFAKAGLKVEEVPITMKARAKGASYKGLVRYGFGIIKAITKVLVDKSYRNI